MHAVIFEVEMTEGYTRAEQDLEQLVTMCKQLPGFMHGTWTQSSGRGLSLLVFESEDAARALADHSQSPPTVVTTRLDVYEVVAEA